MGLILPATFITPCNLSLVSHAACKRQASFYWFWGLAGGCGHRLLSTLIQARTSFSQVFPSQSCRVGNVSACIPKRPLTLYFLGLECTWRREHELSSSDYCFEVLLFFGVSCSTIDLLMCQTPLLLWMTSRVQIVEDWCGINVFQKVGFVNGSKFQSQQPMSQVIEATCAYLVWIQFPRMSMNKLHSSSLTAHDPRTSLFW